MGIKKDEVGFFWVVTMPTANSELVDICFKSDVAGMMRQAKGGLGEEAILGVFKEEIVAKGVANRLLTAIRDP